ncbi:MAG: cysteine hydrolase [Pseudomonadota bacterium]
MHNIHIPAWVTEQIIARRGTAHPYAALDPTRTALVVIDLQNGFMMEGVAHALCKNAIDVVPNVNRLARAIRAAGGKVYWIQNTHDESAMAPWSSLHGMTSPDQVERRIESMSPGTIGHQLWGDLEVENEDACVLKYRFSAFLPGASPLPDLLRRDGCDTVIICGTVTNVCCESSARDAMMTNFKTIMVSDGNAANSDAEHNASLVNFYLTFGDVVETRTLIDWIKRGVDTRPVTAHSSNDGQATYLEPTS